MKNKLYRLIILSWLLCFSFFHPAFGDVRSERHNPDAEPVKNKLMSKAQKSELSLVLALSTNDPYFQNYFVGLSYGYHIKDWISLGILVSSAFNQPTGTTTALSDPQFGKKPDVQPPYLFSLAALEARISPIYGKLNLFSESVIYYDFFILLSGGLMLTHPPLVTEPDASPKFYPYGATGAGQRFFLTRWFALRWEFRSIFTYETFTVRGEQTNFRTDLSFNLGLSLFF